MMSQKTVILTVVLFALIVIGMFTYAHMRKGEIGLANDRFSFFGHGVFA